MTTMVEDIKAAVVSTKRHTGMSGGKKRAAMKREKKVSRCRIGERVAGGRGGGPGNKGAHGESCESERERDVARDA